MAAAPACGNAALTLLSSFLPLLFCFSALEAALIWAPLAEEERSRCCLINGGKKLNGSQHEREREQSDGSPQELL